MSENAKAVFDQLREFVQEKGLNLSFVAGEADIPYHKLWRFKQNEKSLSMEEAERLYFHFTKTTFIIAPDDL
jgi:hypothetical protein